MFKKSIKGILLLVAAGFLFSACAEVKQAGRSIGHGTRDATRAIGHASRDAVKAVGKGVKQVVNGEGKAKK